MLTKGTSEKFVDVDGERVDVADKNLFRRLVPGARYRIHTAIETATFEPIAPCLVTRPGTPPYR